MSYFYMFVSFCTLRLAKYKISLNSVLIMYLLSYTGWMMKGTLFIRKINLFFSKNSFRHRVFIIEKWKPVDVTEISKGLLKII